MIQKLTFTMPEGIEYDDESTPYKDLLSESLLLRCPRYILIVKLEKIWHDIRRYRPTTPLQHTAFVLHLCMLIAVVGPRIIAWGHITRLHGIRYNVTNDLLPTVLLIGIELITAVSWIFLFFSTYPDSDYGYSAELLSGLSPDHLQTISGSSQCSGLFPCRFIPPCCLSDFDSCPRIRHGCCT